MAGHRISLQADQYLSVRQAAFIGVGAMVDAGEGRWVPCSNLVGSPGGLGGEPHVACVAVVADDRDIPG